MGKEGVRNMRKTDIHYRYGIPNEVTVQIDTREQIQLLFPAIVKIGHPELTHLEIPVAVETEKVKLEMGDYRLKEFPNHCIIERKATQLELYKNLNDSNDRIRQAKAFRKLKANCKHPCLLIEASPAALLANGPNVKHPELVAHRLTLAIAKYGFQALFIPWKARNPDVRRKIGTMMIHLMLGFVLQEKFDVPPVLLEEKP
jgi:ERCC4-type nuclease